MDLGFLTTAPFTVPDVSDLPDLALLDAQRHIAEMRRRVDAVASALASEVAHRSRSELGYDGLAQRLGARTPERLVQQIAGVSAREARALVTVALDATPVAEAVRSATVSLDAAHAIRVGLGSPTELVSSQQLDGAARLLLAQAASVTVERLAALARDARAQLDVTSVTDHERLLHSRRTFRVWRRGDGMVVANGLFGPEDGAILLSAYDAATSPRRGGPRFVDPSASNEPADDRTVEQAAADAFVELVRLGGSVDARAIGSARPAVQLLVRDTDLRSRRGAGRIEGSQHPVSIDTVDRAVCDAGVTPIIIDSIGQVIDLGRSQRLFSHRQRIALAARDGGCRFPGCDRPPSWCEAHHIVEWSRGGRTDLSNGILLCRHHHLLVHNNGWEITLTSGEYCVVPPASVDPARRGLPAPSRNALVREVA